MRFPRLVMMNTARVVRSFSPLLLLPVLCLPACSGAGSRSAAASGTAPTVNPIRHRHNLTTAVMQTSAPAAVVPIHPPAGIPNFHVVHPSLLRGAAPTPQGLQELKAMGVRTIIDLRIAPKTVAKERKIAESLGLKWINLPMSSDPPTTREIQTFLATTTNPPDQPVFVHCQHGADRAGTMIGIYREQIDHWPFDRAFKEMRKYGFNPTYSRLTRTVKQYAAGKPQTS